MGAAHSAAPPSPAVPGEWKPLVDEKAAHPADYELPKVFEALHVPRLLASFHVIAFHFPISTPWAASICGWGKVWVGFFMMLSGFGAAHSRLEARALVEHGERLARVERVAPEHLAERGVLQHGQSPIGAVAQDGPDRAAVLRTGRPGEREQQQRQGSRRHERTGLAARRASTRSEPSCILEL